MAIFNILINGAVKTKVQGPDNTNIPMCVDYLSTLGITVQESVDLVSIERLDKPYTFPASAYMQIDEFALEVHINNLFATYGRDTVLKEFLKHSGSAA